MKHPKTNRKTHKRKWRKVRSRLKQKLTRKASISKHLTRHYHVYLSRKAATIYSTSINHAKIPSGTYNIRVPKVLCFIADPDGTLEFLTSLQARLMSINCKNISIDHSKAKIIGIGASHVFDSAIVDYQKRMKSAGFNVAFSGILPDNKDTINFLVAHGLLERLNVKQVDQSSYDRQYKDYYFRYRIDGTKQQNIMPKAVMGLVKYFEKCLNHKGISIDPLTKHTLNKMFGEILDNAQTHCGSDEETWSVLGYYDEKSSQCSFAVINSGMSIYENLSSPSSTASKHIKSLIKSMKNGLWTAQHRRLAKQSEAIWTLMAFQEGISSRRTKSGMNSSCGQGLMDVLEFAESVKDGTSGANLCVVSGRSYISIDGSYHIKEKNIANSLERRRIIPMNAEGRLDRLPDRDKVFVLTNEYKGTIFSGSIRLRKG